MRALAALHAGLINLLAVLAGILLALMALAIVVDVVMRNLGFQPPGHTLALTEYSLLYITMLAAPWLVRAKGHVHIELLTAAVGPRTRLWLARLVAALCVLTCAVICLVRPRGDARPLPARAPSTCARSTCRAGCSPRASRSASA